MRNSFYTRLYFIIEANVFSATRGGRIKNYFIVNWVHIMHLLLAFGRLSQVIESLRLPWSNSM